MLCSTGVDLQLLEIKFSWFPIISLLFRTAGRVGAGGNKIKANSAQLSWAGAWAELGNTKEYYNNKKPYPFFLPTQLILVCSSPFWRPSFGFCFSVLSFGLKKNIQTNYSCFTFFYDYFFFCPNYIFKFQF